MYNLSGFPENFNSRQVPFQGSFRFNEPMANHTSFKTGGPADLWIRPEGECFLESAVFVLEYAKNEVIPVFFLGGGANIVVSDEGIRGIVLDTTGYSGEIPANFFTTNDTNHHEPSIINSKRTLSFRSGTLIDDAVETAAAKGFSGLEFMVGLPGSVGGALWMNARCYEKEIADVVLDVQLLEDGKVVTQAPKREEFSYKKSPFQNKSCLLLAVSFKLQEKEPELIRIEMEKYRKDRESKGHYRFPSAGSVFKNNKAFGKPTGKIIDELGLKGRSIGDAQIAPWHGNIIINKGKAKSSDILALVEFMEERVKAELGLKLEREIIFC